MTEPLVACIMLTKDRPEMAKRAVESFRRQTYQNKVLGVIDTGSSSTFKQREFADFRPGGEMILWRSELGRLTIGALRNFAIKAFAGQRDYQSFLGRLPDIVIHWDSDDYSHPNRITEQVALLRASGRRCVGYRDMLFWNSSQSSNVEIPDEDQSFKEGWVEFPMGQAWLYTNQDPRYCLGTSLAYFRSAWEARPFPDISRGEDRNWLREIDSLGISCLGPSHESDRLTKEMMDPRMIASIHSDNHVKYETTSAEWKRVPEWDAYCRERMAL